MSNPHIDLALMCLARRSLDLKEDIHRMQRQITRDGDGLRLMGDDRTLGEHLADTERMLDGVKLAVAHLESLQ